ncbi:MAG: type II secretion system F family protein [Deltaproteobacteria bacterium]|nr:type II secretion system F family protein [Deltaproteobacteria bacterium]
MPMFVYEGRTSQGDMRKGEIEAANQAAVMTKLREMKIKPTSVKKKGGIDLSADINIPMPAFLQPKVGEKDLVVFTRQFATMIDSGLPLVQCLEIQANNVENPTFQKQLTEIKETVEGGATFADALKKFPKTFDPLYVNLVAAGEVGGILDTILNRLAAYIEKNNKLKRQVKGAMVYPIAILSVMVIILWVIMRFVVPTFDQMFSEVGAELPVPTQILITMSNFVVNYGLYAIVGLVIFFYVFRRALETETGRRLWDSFLLKMPIFGDLLRKVAVARFCRTLGTMISSGVPILDALEICSRSAGNYVVEDAIMKTRDSISEGRTIAEPLAESGVFPGMVCQMINVGEATGALDTMLNKIADFYDDEVEVAVNGITSLIEPFIIVFLGVVVGGLVVALYLPIFGMAGAVG